MSQHEHDILSKSQRIARIGSWLWSMKGPLWWSAEMYRIYGVSPDTFTPTVESLPKLIHPEDQPALQAWIEACAAGDTCGELEFRTVLPDGSVRWISGRGGLQKDNNNKSIYIAGTVQDITERKHAEQDLIDALNYSRLLIDVSLIGVIVYKATGACVFANETAAKIIGATVDQIKMQNFRELESWKESGLLDIAERALSTNSVIEANIHINSNTFGKEGWFTTRFAPFNYKSEQHLLRLFLDITEKKKIEDQNITYVTKLEAAFLQTVTVITALGEMRDPYTAGHERRVAEIAVAIGVELGFDAHQQQGLRVAGHLHDIGKITIPGELLSKPGKLSATEFALVKEHAQAGYAVLKNVEFPWPVAQVALQHHERIDGSGYPQNLKDDEITLEARIVAVADVIEAMASHRPYRPALGIKKALAAIKRGRGTLFDADVTDACLRLFREKRYQLPV